MVKVKVDLDPCRIVCVFCALCASGMLAADDPVSSSRSALPRLVDLGADRCIPCKMMKPILDELTKDYAGPFEVGFIDVGKNPNEDPASVQAQLILPHRRPPRRLFPDQIW